MYVSSSSDSSVSTEPPGIITGVGLRLRRVGYDLK